VELSLNYGRETSVFKLYYSWEELQARLLVSSLEFDAEFKSIVECLGESVARLEALK
jgi:hypothetical protein